MPKPPSRIQLLQYSEYPTPPLQSSKYYLKNATPHHCRKPRLRALPTLQPHFPNPYGSFPTLPSPKQFPPHQEGSNHPTCIHRSNNTNTIQYQLSSGSCSSHLPAPDSHLNDGSGFAISLPHQQTSGTPIKPSQRHLKIATNNIKSSGKAQRTRRVRLSSPQLKLKHEITCFKAGGLHRWA